MQTILGANGVIGHELARRLPAYTDRVRLVSRTPQRVNGADELVKADLLDAIDRERSITAAAKAMGMSYRRAWLLVDAMNRSWRDPLVETSSSPAVRTGARLTPFGRGILHLYRSLQEQAGSLAALDEWDELSAALLPEPCRARKVRDRPARQSE